MELWQFGTYREEGISLVKKYDSEFPKKYLKELYGSVKPTEISKLIQEENKIDIKPSMIQPVEEIKTLGKFKKNWIYWWSNRCKKRFC